jgi:hypothetical protein
MLRAFTRTYLHRCSSAITKYNIIGYPPSPLGVNGYQASVILV